jgi:peroxiredoxin family protein
MPPSDTAPDRLSLVVFSGNYDKVHYALTMAAAALAVNIPATLFFTMGALRALCPETGAGGGWRGLPATESGDSPSQADERLISRGLAGFEEMLHSCVALGATFMVCEMGMRAMDMAATDLRGDVPVTPGGLVTFLADASRTGATMFV